MPSIKGITISVGYAPLLNITLARNLRHLAECLVVTSLDDDDTADVARSVPDVRLHRTDAFTRHGAKFNKGLGMEEGFEILGCDGWVLIWDADCLFPESMPLDSIRPGHLYGARRRILEDPSRWHPGLDWRQCELSRDGGAIGFFQLFHAQDPHVRDKRPWYDVTFAHAGGCDAAFMFHWPSDKHVILPIDLLHLGPKDTNWFGTDAAAVDQMAHFVTHNGWSRAASKFSREQVERAGPYDERVDVPGYPPSAFELPFVRRARQRRAEGR